MLSLMSSESELRTHLPGSILDEDQRSGSSALRIAQQPGTYTYADHSRSQSLFFRTALVAKNSSTAGVVLSETSTRFYDSIVVPAADESA